MRKRKALQPNMFFQIFHFLIGVTFILSLLAQIKKYVHAKQSKSKNMYKYMKNYGSFKNVHNE